MNRFDRMYYLLNKMSHESLLREVIERLEEETAGDVFDTIERINGIEPANSDEFNEKWYDDKWDEQDTKL